MLRYSLNKVCQIEDWREPHLAPHPVHRKHWEYAQFMHGLETLGALHSEAVALGVAAGHETPLYQLTNHCKQVHATDLYGSSLFAAGEADASMLTDPDRFYSHTYNRRRLVVQHMNALDLRYEDNVFDIVYSLSSIEHMGGMDEAKRCLGEMSRVCRNGGIVAFATEFVVNGTPHLSAPSLELFTPETLRELLESSPRLSLVERLHLEISEPTLRTSMSLTEALTERGAQLPHIVLEYEGRQFTSVMVYLRKR